MIRAEELVIIFVASRRHPQSSATVIPFDSPELLTLAASAAINQRAAGAYLHDLRGSMQALQGAMELLTRITKTGVADLERREKASALAKRAVSNHDALINTLFNRLSGGALRTAGMPKGFDAEPFSWTTLLQEAIYFSRQESDRAQIKFLFLPGDDLYIAADRDQVFVLTVGLLHLALDTFERLNQVEIKLFEAAGFAVLSIQVGAAHVLDSNAMTLRYGEHFLSSLGGDLKLQTINTEMPLLVARFPVAEHRV